MLEVYCTVLYQGIRNSDILDTKAHSKTAVSEICATMLLYSYLICLGELLTILMHRYPYRYIGNRPSIQNIDSGILLPINIKFVQYILNLRHILDFNLIPTT